MRPPCDVERDGERTSLGCDDVGVNGTCDRYFTPAVDLDRKFVALEVHSSNKAPRISRGDFSLEIADDKNLFAKATYVVHSLPFVINWKRSNHRNDH